MPLMTIERIKTGLLELFTGAGLGEKDAATLTGILIDAEASGRATHGLIRVRPMLKRLAGHGHRPGRWLREEPCCALLDAEGGLGYLTGHACALRAIEMLRGSPVAVIGVRGATHTGPIGYFARMIALEGHIGMVYANCSAMAAPHGAREPVLGTNPVAMAFPRERGEPVVTDLGTTATTYGECRVAINEGRELPAGVALDSSGEPTTDPVEAIRGGCLLPFGGHKGYALSVAVQLLTSAFTGAAAVPEPGGDYGLTVIGLRADMLVTREEYNGLIEELLARLKEAASDREGGEVLYPGERSGNKRRLAEEQGIEVSDRIYSDLFAAREAPDSNA